MNLEKTLDKPPQMIDISPWWAYIVGLGSSAIIWFLAWGLRDVKRRYDIVPELSEQQKAILRRIRAIERKLNIESEDSASDD